MTTLDLRVAPRHTVAPAEPGDPAGGTRPDRAASWWPIVPAFWLIAVASLGAAFPAPQKYVADEAHVVSATATAAINASLRDLERDTTAEIAVVTVNSLDGLTVEDYANQLFKAWGIGKKGADNGVLVLVAPGEHKMRIEVGYGLEPILPDGLAGEIIRQQFTPSFKSGDFSGGIQRGVDRLAAVVRAKHVLTPEERKALAAASEDRPPRLLMIPFFGVFVGMAGFFIGGGLRSRTFFPLLFGSVFGGIPFLMSLIPFFNAPPLVLLGIALVAGVLGYRKGDVLETDGEKRSRTRGTRGWTLGAASSSGSSGSGGSSSSGSSGSFGGGSSGGGGASGSW